MTENKWLRLASFSMMLILAFACKKDEEKDTKLYMEGALVNIPSYIIAGQDLNIKAEGITKPVDSLTYKWFTSGFSADSLFGREIIISSC
ncbi:hypothetical protein MASR1M46_17130 [Bacteroidales bacterium]